MSRADRERQKKQPPPITASPGRPKGQRGRPVTPLIPIDEASLGPAMLALSPGMRAFVYAKVHLGLTNVEAGKLAGYSTRSPNSLEVHTSQLAHHPNVQAAILEEGQKLMRAEGARSIRTLVEIRDSATADNRDRIRCAVELLNRSGFHAVSESHHHEHVHMTEGEKDRRILALCAELGISEPEARKMLIAPTEMQKNAAGIYELPPPEPAQEPTEEERRRAVYRQRENENRRRRRRMTPEEVAADKDRAREAWAERLRCERAEHEARREVEPTPIDVTEGSQDA